MVERAIEMNKGQWLIGLLLLGSILFFGLYGIVATAAAGDAQVYNKDALYIEECGACHLAYPPGLLPTASGRGIMAGLEDHFGENAELDEESAAHISSYLEREALRSGEPTTMSKMLRNLPAEPPLRITEFPAFLSAHQEIAEQLDMETFPLGFLSPCADCHRQAADALFDKELLHPGYGPPQAWKSN
jgi:hypothetical protein